MATINNLPSLPEGHEWNISVSGGRSPELTLSIIKDLRTGVVTTVSDTIEGPSSTERVLLDGWVGEEGVVTKAEETVTTTQTFFKATTVVSEVVPESGTRVLTDLDLLKAATGMYVRWQLSLEQAEEAERVQAANAEWAGILKSQGTVD